MTNAKEYIEMINDRLVSSNKAQEWLWNNNIIEFEAGMTVAHVLNKVASKWEELTDDSKREVATNIGGIYNLASTLTFFNNYKTQ